MRKFGFILSVLLALSCRKENDRQPVQMHLEAMSDSTPRSVVNSGSIEWSATDELSVFDGSANNCFKASSQGSSVRFSGQAQDKESYLVLYPYRAESAASGTTVTATIPSVQIPSKGSFAQKANVSTGISRKSSEGHSVSMKNVGCFLKFSVAAESAVKLLNVRSIGGEALSGDVSIELSGSEPVASAVTGVSSVSCKPDGEFFAPGEYYAVMLPCQPLSAGLSIEVTLADGSSFIKNFTSLGSLLRNKVYVISNPIESKDFNLVLEGTSESIEAETAASKRPYLLCSADELGKMKSLARNKSLFFTQLHEAVISAAGELLTSSDVISYPSSSETPLEVFRPFVRQITFLTYAYRMTGDRQYLDKVSSHLEAACALKDWCPSKSFLATSELAYAVSLAYDWLYSDLSDSLKASILAALKAKILDIYPSYSAYFYKVRTNWNQICCSGIMTAAVAVYGPDSAQANEVLNYVRTSLMSTGCLKSLYCEGSGVYAEGCGYWSYGTSYQILLNSVVEHSFGADEETFSTDEGFRKTGKYMGFTNGSVYSFNYSDNSASLNTTYELFYFASKFNDYSSVYQVVTRPVSASSRMSVLHLVWAARIDESKFAPSDDLLFYGNSGSQQIVIARSGWTKNSRYLGLKGGYAGINHGHMDAGSFVYDCDGVRWSAEPPTPSYPTSEANLSAKGGNLWLMDASSLRWHIMGYNNRWHSTLTVNNSDHIPGSSAIASVGEIFDSAAKRGGSVDITGAFGGALSSAVRTAAIINDSYLEVSDVLKAPSGSSATVEFRMWSYAEPSVTEAGITLSKDGKSLTLSASGAPVSYTLFSTDPADYEPVLQYASEFQSQPSGRYLCGWTVTIPAGETYSIVTTLK